MKFARIAFRALLALCPLLLWLPLPALAGVTVEIQLRLTPGDTMMRPLPEPSAPRAQYAVNTISVPNRAGCLNLDEASRVNGIQNIEIAVPAGPAAITGQRVEHFSRVSLRIDTDSLTTRGTALSTPLTVVLDIPSHMGTELLIRYAPSGEKAAGHSLKAMAVPCIIEEGRPHSVLRNVPSEVPVIQE